MPTKAPYPPNWRELVAVVRERSGDRCEARLSDGTRCALPNHVWIHRDRRAPTISIICDDDACIAGDAAVPKMHGEPWSSPVYIVLTTAHLCQDSLCDRIDHLAHWCQLHHLRFDAAQHARNAATTRRQKRVAAGQGEML